MSYFITVKQPPKYKQMTLEELLFGVDTKSALINPNTTNTRTYKVENINQKFLDMVDVPYLIGLLEEFNHSTEQLRSVPRSELYNTFHIPKKSRGLRRIDAPNTELMDALRRLKMIFEDDFHALYHTSAFAYVKKRSTIDAIKRHQANESKWFGKYDLSNFFGNTTIDFVMKMFSMIFPFSEIMKNTRGYEELYKAIELAFLNGGLPQGTPISPLITNIMMIPIDYELSNGLRDYNNQRYIYTRYADDFQVSSKYNFSFREIEKYIVEVLASYDAPFTIKAEKTRYGSSSGSNWNLGVMLNKDNEITVGHKKKRQFQAMLSSYIMDKKNGINWDLNDIQTMEGYRNYFRMVEGESIDRIVEHISHKFDVDVVSMIKNDLKNI